MLRGGSSPANSRLLARAAAGLLARMRPLHGAPWMLLFSLLQQIRFENMFEISAPALAIVQVLDVPGVLDARAAHNGSLFDKRAAAVSRRQIARRKQETARHQRDTGNN